MEGYAVLRAAALAGLPAVEVRVLANAIGEPDRSKWRFEDAKAELAAALPRCSESSSVPELPAPLPPAERTVGQLIAETIRAYGHHFWRALPLGLPLALPTQLSLGHTANVQTLVLSRSARSSRPRTSGRAGSCTARRSPRPRTCARCSCSRRAVPRAPVSCCRRSRGSRSSASRSPPRWSSDWGSARRSSAGGSSALADYVHALGSLAALVIVVGVSELTLIALLRSQGDNGQRAARRARRPRAQPAPLPRRRTAVSRPGGEGRLPPTRPKETPRCRSSSSCRP